MAATEHPLYYGTGYWNELTVVAEELNRRATGDPSTGWMDHFPRFADGGTFRRALVLNCGDGHVERELVRRGLVSDVVAHDLDETLLREADRRARELGLPIAYVRSDVNDASFGCGPFDLVVNHAAGHHIRAIDAVFREICRVTSPDGLLVSWDYVGPHRNQYPWEDWEAMHRANRAVPVDVRRELVYPHLPTMLATDPSEAVHSELVATVLDRYFTPVHHADLGGTIAYELLSLNERLHAADPALRDRVAAEVMALDAAHLAAHPGSSYFSYDVVRPDHRVLDDADRLEEWRAEERCREAGTDRDGRYGDRTVLQELTDALSDARLHAEHARSWADDQVALARSEEQAAREELARLRDQLEVARNELARARTGREALRHLARAVAGRVTGRRAPD